MVKVHLHEEQFDGQTHAWCCRSNGPVVSEQVFEATPFKERCFYCNRNWFPTGQPDWHYKAAVERMKGKKHGSKKEIR